jgi:hypothetical protein
MVANGDDFGLILVTTEKEPRHETTEAHVPEA